MGFFRHLPKDEILAQYFIADEMVRAEGRRISHIVFMGMGEPLDNYDNVIYSANRFLEPGRIHLSHKHVTISTSGINPKIATLANDCKASLAVSLHAARDDLRTELMPINRKYPLAELKQELMNYQKVTGKKITLEYILIKDKNCGPKEAKELVKWIHGMRVKVNLIPFNAHPGLPYDRPADADIEYFSRYLNDRSISAPVRYSKGLDVSAACGQLAAKKMGQFDQVPRRKDLLLGTEPSTSNVILSAAKDLKTDQTILR
jgi:23S rRNA (adenine2503-C2)-methyltransferase